MDIPTQPTHRPFLRKKKHPPFFRKAVGWVGWLLKIPPKIADAIPVMAHTWHSDIETRRLLRHRRCWRFCANETILHGPKTQRRRAATVDVEGLSLQLGRPSAFAKHLAGASSVQIVVSLEFGATKPRFGSVWHHAAQRQRSRRVRCSVSMPASFWCVPVWKMTALVPRVCAAAVP